MKIKKTYYGVKIFYNKDIVRFAIKIVKENEHKNTDEPNNTILHTIKNMKKVF
jgi:hypothetical protein